MKPTHRHIKTNELLSIKNIRGNVAVCYIEKPYKIYNNIIVDICVCRLDNLKPIDL